MNLLESFLTISVAHLNLFSFMLGMLYTLSNVTLRNQRFLWIQLLLYVTGVALYYFGKTLVKV